MRCFQQIAVVCIAVLFSVSTWSHAQVSREWVAGDGLWMDPGNWSPTGAPSFVDGAYLGSSPFAHNNDVNIEVGAAAAEIEITDGMVVNTGGYTVLVIFDTLVSGKNEPNRESKLEIQGMPGQIGFQTTNLLIEDEARVRLDENGILQVNNLLDVNAGSSIAGNGIVRVQGDNGIALNNDGRITAGEQGLTIFQQGDGLIDLDGGSGDGILNVWDTSVINGAGNLTFNATEFADSFSGLAYFINESVLNMNLDSGWTADANSSIFVHGRDELPQSARIIGSHFTVGGVLRVLNGGFPADEPGRLRIESDADIIETADVWLQDGNLLEFSGVTKILGGNFDVDEGAALDFDGPTSVQGGIFTTFSQFQSDGSVRFTGPTTWDGTINVAGIARQYGDATVAGNTHITAGVFDMDGISNTVWDVNNFLSINASAINAPAGNHFNGTMNINVGIFSEVAINLSSPEDHWTMSGTTNLFNNLPFESTRISGSPMELTGELNVEGTNIRIMADTEFADGSTTDYVDPGSSLVMRGQTTVATGALFTGNGEMINGSGGEMILQNGSSLNQSGLINRSHLEVGNPTGIASVASFESTPDANWQVEIGGFIAGDEFDVLLVSDGDTILDGTLSVKLIDAGNGLFSPRVDDEFTILSSVGSIVGQFDNNPISISDGNGYQWEVLYNPNDITLRLDSIDTGFLLGDINQDGIVDLLDVAPFVDVLTSGVYEIRADINCDSTVDLLDVSLFVDLLTG